MAQKHLRAATHVVSDGLSCFASVTTAGCTHEAIVTGGGPASVNHEAFTWVNTMLGNVKNAIQGMYHGICPRTARAHTGRLVTQRPNQLWGTDGIRVETVEDGWVWGFTAVDHWDAGCVGHHVVQVGSRFAVREPIAMGLKAYFGRTAAQAGRGLSLRMDHGTQYTSDHCLNRIRFWGITPSFAFVAEPETKKPTV